MILNSPYITGSLTVTGNTTLMGALTVTGSLSGTAATASFALTLGGTGSVGFATTGAFSATSGSASSRLTQIEQVYATTGSNSFRATQSITGSLTVTGQIIAQTLNVQQVTSSIIYSSGSNTFGCDINSRQTFTGSFYQTGSVAVFNSNVGIGTDRLCSKLVVETNASPNLTGWITSGTQFAANTTFGYASLNIGAYDNGSNCRYGWIRTAFNDNAAVPADMVLLTGPSERVRIVSTGITCFACQVCMPRFIAENGIGQGSILRQTDSNGYSSLRLYNDQNSANRALEIDYAGSTYPSALVTDGIVGESAAITTTGAYPLQFATCNTFRAVILANGNLGVGTTAPGSILHVKGGSAGGACFGAELRVWENTFGAVLQGSTVGNTAAFLGNFRYNFVAPSNSVTNYLSAGHGISFYDGVHIFSSCPGGSSGGTFTPAERLTILNSGIIRTPSQVSFKAYLSSNISPSKGTNVTVPYNIEDYDTQGNFSTSTYKFTAPVAGKYLFTVNFNPYQLDDTAYLRLMLLINASDVRTLFLFQNMPTGNTGDVNVSGADILNLAANDTVEVRVVTDGSGTFGMSQGLTWNSFSGHLLG